MKNIFKNADNWLHRKCDNLSSSKRKQVVCLLSGAYLLLTIVVVATVFFPTGNKVEERNFKVLTETDTQQDTLAITEPTRNDTLNGIGYEK